MNLASGLDFFAGSKRSVPDGDSKLSKKKPREAKEPEKSLDARDNDSVDEKKV